MSITRSAFATSKKRASRGSTTPLRRTEGFGDDDALGGSVVVWMNDG
ncbi:MAG: hypothetical protein ABSF50_01245 [Burkholderiaceae bacterium]|jgi:hypothetical protein